MTAKKATKKGATPTAKKTTKKAAKKAAKQAVPKKKSVKKPPTLEQIQEAAYFHFLKRTSEGLPGDSGDDWAAAMKQLGA